MYLLPAYNHYRASFTPNSDENLVSLADFNKILLMWHVAVHAYFKITL